MSKSNTSTQVESYRIGLIEFIPGLFRFIRMLPSIMKAVKVAKGIKLDTYLSIGTCIEENAEKYGNCPALLYENEVYTYHEFNEHCNQVANYFLSIGLKKGNVVVLLLENRPEYLFCLAGLAKIGAIGSLVNPNLRGPVLEHSVTIVPPSAIVVGEEMEAAFEEIRPGLKLDPVCKIHYLADRSTSAAPEGLIDLKTELNKAPSSNPEETKGIQARDPICYMFTSGTTGKPKAVIVENQKWLKSKCLSSLLFQLSLNDVVYVTLPFSHGTANTGLWTAAVEGGAAMVMKRKFSAGRFWEDVRKYNVTAFGYIDELCRYLMNQPPHPHENNHGIKMIGGNGLRPDIWKEFKKRFGIPQIKEFYAATEGNLAFSNVMNLDCTIGICFTPHAVVKYDVEADEPVRDKNGFMQRVSKGEAGLLLGEITEDAPFIGYTDAQATERKIFRDVFIKGDAYFNTGDLIRQIGFGHSQFVDRVGDTFRWKGENVSTTEVEEVITTLEQVNESAVYGVKIPGTEGRAGMASVILETEFAEFDFKGFAASLRQALPSYAIPIFIRLQEEFELTATWKRIKSTLKQDGFNPGEIKDPLFIMLPGTLEYTRLTEEVYEKIHSIKFRF